MLFWHFRMLMNYTSTPIGRLKKVHRIAACKYNHVQCSFNYRGWGTFHFHVAYYTPPQNEVFCFVFFFFFGGGGYRNHPVWLSVRLFVRLSVQSKLNLGYNFWTKRNKAFILHMCVPCDKTFLSVPKIFTSWPWPWLLTYFWKNLTLDITF